MEEEVDNFNYRTPRGKCGKVCFDKKTAQTRKNQLMKKGIVKVLRVYNCQRCEAWHLTKSR